MSQRQAVLQELINRLVRIQTANGFETNAGALVFIGERPALGPSDPAASIAVVVKQDNPGYQGERISVELPVQVSAVIQADMVSTVSVWKTIEKVISDIKTAVENTTSGVPDHDFGALLIRRGLERGPTEPYDREAGDNLVGSTVNYTLRYVELWGAP